MRGYDVVSLEKIRTMESITSFFVITTVTSNISYLALGN